MFTELLGCGKAHDVHRIMDAAHAVLGKRHRIIAHDPITIGLFFLKNKKKGIAALSHVMLDRNKKLQKLMVIMDALR